MVGDVRESPTLEFNMLSKTVAVSSAMIPLPKVIFQTKIEPVSFILLPLSNLICQTKTGEVFSIHLVSSFDPIIQIKVEATHMSHKPSRTVIFIPFI